MNHLHLHCLCSSMLRNWKIHRLLQMFSNPQYKMIYSCDRVMRCQNRYWVLMNHLHYHYHYHLHPYSCLCSSMLRNWKIHSFLRRLLFSNPQYKMRNSGSCLMRCQHRYWVLRKMRLVSLSDRFLSWCLHSFRHISSGSMKKCLRQRCSL